MDQGNQSPNQKLRQQRIDNYEKEKKQAKERQKKIQEQLRRNEVTRHISIIRGRQ